MNKKLLIALIAISSCVLIAAGIGLFLTVTENQPDIQPLTTMPQQIFDTATTAPVYVQPQQAVVNTTAAQQQNGQPAAQQPATQAAAQTPAQQGAGDTLPQTDAEWLAFFNESVNKLKTGQYGFTKNKITETQDIKLSNSLANSFVSMAKDSLLSTNNEDLPIAKGDTATAVAQVSPDGASFVSALTMSDIRSIQHSVDANGNRTIRVDMNDMTNPDLNSSYAKIFEFMTVDDVLTTHAPKLKATVERENIQVVFSGCYAEANIAADGTPINYKTYVSARMILTGGKISVISTDVDVQLMSTTTYSNIA